MNDNIYTVSQVNKYIKLVIEDDVLLNKIYVEGEISNLKYHSVGHIYFTLKDEECSINCIVYANKDIDVKNTLKNGEKITCFGNITSYPKTGQYQILVEDIKKTGLGEVFLDFEKLKEKLQKQGFFDEVYKMPLPKMPKTVGIISSETGAGLRDILKVGKRINKNTKFIIIPALVQGKQAPKSIVDAIELANEYKKLDVIILARGGGSKEDLWCFNDENVAKAIFYSSIPIITGIGHEIDFTIADFVADYRASTPSSAVEICLQEYKVAKEKLNASIYELNNAMDKTLKNKKLIFNHCLNAYSLEALNRKIQYLKKDTQNTFFNIEKSINNKIKQEKLKLDLNIQKIEDVSPIKILKKGYALVSDEQGKPIKTGDKLKKDDVIKINFSDGEKVAKILE